MARTRFEVRFNDGELPGTAWSERGIDQAEFFVSPNPGEDLATARPNRLGRRVVAGDARAEDAGQHEARRDFGIGSGLTKTLIFDEVDAGIGGRVADVVGSRLQELGHRFQVLCITHLPQIAARGTTQFLIEKSVRGSRTVTRVERLDSDGTRGGSRADDWRRLDHRAGSRERSRTAQTAGRKRLAGRKAKGESESPRDS